MRKEVRTPKTSFTRQELITFSKAILDAFASDCCPNCELMICWRDRISEADLKDKILELGINFTEEDDHE